MRYFTEKNHFSLSICAFSRRSREMQSLSFIMGLLYMMISFIPDQMTSQRFNMYYTDQAMKTQDHDCLSYTVLDDIYDFYGTPLFQHQSILYCFRPTNALNECERKSH